MANHGITYYILRNRYLLWKQILENAGGRLSTALDLSSLSQITDGYTPGDMVTAVRAVLVPRRVQIMAIKPLTAVEFVPPLARLNAVNQAEEKEYRDWYVVVE